MRYFLSKNNKKRKKNIIRKNKKRKNIFTWLSIKFPGLTKVNPQNAMTDNESVATINCGTLRHLNTEQRDRRDNVDSAPLACTMCFVNKYTQRISYHTILFLTR